MTNKRDRKRLRLRERYEFLTQAHSGNLINPKYVRCIRKLHKVGFSPLLRLFLAAHPKSVWEDDQTLSTLAGVKEYRCLRVYRAFKQAVRTSTNLSRQDSKFLATEMPPWLLTQLKILRRAKKDVWSYKQGVEQSRSMLLDKRCIHEVREAFSKANRFWSNMFGKNDPLDVKTDGGFIPKAYTLEPSVSFRPLAGGAKELVVVVSTRDYMLGVYKPGLQVLDGYPVLSFISKCPLTGEITVKLPFISFAVLGGVRKAVFHKPKGRKNFWEIWKPADDGETWRFKYWC